MDFFIITPKNNGTHGLPGIKLAVGTIWRVGINLQTNSISLGELQTIPFNGNDPMGGAHAIVFIAALIFGGCHADPDQTDATPVQNNEKPTLATQSGALNVPCSSTADCDDNATCNNTDGSFTCSCNAGYTGDGVTCAADTVCTEGDLQNSTLPCPDPTTGPFWLKQVCQGGVWIITNCAFDYCGIGADNCSANSACNNAQGGWECNCNAGYSVSGGCASGTCFMSGTDTCYCSAGDTDDA
jgi:hypothetical protein